MHDRRDREKEKRRKGSEWELERSQRHGVMECVGMVGGGGGKGCSLHAHIRGHPDVTSSRESDSVREEGDQRDIVSQTLLKGGQSNTVSTQGLHNHKLSRLLYHVTKLRVLTISCGVLLTFSAGSRAGGGLWGQTNLVTNTCFPLMSRAVA